MKKKLLLSKQLYTERQKKHHFFRATLTKIQSIKVNHILTQFSYSTPYKAHLKNRLVESKRSI